MKKNSKPTNIDLTVIMELDAANSIELAFEQHPRFGNSQTTVEELTINTSIETSKDLTAAIKKLAPAGYHKLLRSINIFFSAPGEAVPSDKIKGKIFFAYDEFFELIELLDSKGKILVLSKSIKNAHDLIIALKKLSLENSDKLLSSKKIQFPTLIQNTLPNEMKGKLFFAYNIFWSLIKTLAPIKQILLLLHVSDLGLVIETLFDVPLILLEEQEFTTLIESIKTILPRLFNLDKLERIAYRLQPNRGKELIRAYIRNAQGITAQSCLSYINSRKLWIQPHDTTEELRSLFSLILFELLSHASIVEAKEILIALFDSENVDDSKLYFPLTKMLNCSLIERLALDDLKFWSEQCAMGGTEREGYKIPEKVARLMDYAQAHRNNSYDQFLEGLDKIRNSGVSWASFFRFFRSQATQKLYNSQESLHTIAKDFKVTYYFGNRYK